MLPQFPSFKALELADAEYVRRYALRYGPFSEFNFASLWAWNLDNSVLLSELNGNLVVRLTDYASGASFYSLLGDSKLNGAVEALISLSCREKLQPRLQLVPETVAEKLDKNVFSITEDDNHADYILLVDRLLTYQGTRLAAKRNEVRKFSRLCPTGRFGLLDLNDAAVIEESRVVFERWIERRAVAHLADTQRELKAFERCLNSQDQLRLIGTGIFAGDAMVAFSILQIVDDRNAVTLFEKADTSEFPGIGSFLNQQVANLLAAQGIRYINIEQDLGIAGLRMSKRSYDPCAYLKKFNVCYRGSEAA
jgi:uncharacterized protein